MVVTKNKFLHDPQRHHFEQKKPDTKEYLLHDAIQAVPEQVNLTYNERLLRQI